MHRKLYALAIVAGLALFAGCDSSPSTPPAPCRQTRNVTVVGVLGAPLGTYTILEAHNELFVDGGSLGSADSFFIPPAAPCAVHTVGYRLDTCFSPTIRVCL